MVDKSDKSAPAPKLSGRRYLPRFDNANAATNYRLVEAIGVIATERGCTPAQLALAWLLHQGADIVPIPGTRSTQRLDENAAATRIELSREELQRINALLAAVSVTGTRYPEQSMTSLNR